MTLIPTVNLEILTHQQLTSTQELKPSDISVIVPVRDNASGLNKLLKSAKCNPKLQFQELIIVDDGSQVPLRLDEINPDLTLQIHIVRTQGVGPAGARNRGASQATGDWLLFIDSDCLFTETLISAYEHSMNGAVGYAGHVKALGQNFISDYYDSHRILIPLIDETGTPLHVIAANTLIWRKAFEVIGGFDETFYLAAGEDIDLGFRLRQVGSLRYVSNAIILHEYGGALKFCERFFRYGRAHTMLERKYSVSFRPQKENINHARLTNHILAFVQYLVTLIGYHFEMKKK